MAAFVVAITTATVSLNRTIWWVIIPAVVLSAIAIWVMVSWSGTVLRVEKDADGTRWLMVKDAQLGKSVIMAQLTQYLTIVNCTTQLPHPTPSVP